MLPGRKKEVKKEENKLSSGYSGRTQKLLREGKKKLAETEQKVALILLDGEDRAPCVINEATWVERSELDAPMVATALVAAAAANQNPLPDMSKFVSPTPDTVMSLIAAHQAEQMRDMLAREAGAEALRRALLVAEKVEWRAAQMAAMFDAERTEAHNRLKVVMAEFRNAKDAYRVKFSKEAAALEKLAEAEARKAAWLAEEAAKPGMVIR